MSAGVAGCILFAGASAILGACEVRTKESPSREAASASEGAACLPSTGKCVGPAAAFVCVDGKLARRTCSGPAGCVEEGTGDAAAVVCTWAVGDRCGANEESQGACAPDGKALLQCRGGEVRAQPCRGKSGCQAAGDSIRCDTSIARPGEPCGADAAADGGVACSEDALTQLTCKGGKFVQTLTCGGPTKCTVAADGVSCDWQVGAVGDACDEQDAWACSTDRKSRLACKSGKLVFDQTCPKPCVVDDGFVVCH